MEDPSPASLLLIGPVELKAIAAWPHAFGGYPLPDDHAGTFYNGERWMEIAGIYPARKHHELATRLLDAGLIGPQGEVPDLVRKYLENEVKRRLK